MNFSYSMENYNEENKQKEWNTLNKTPEQLYKEQVKEARIEEFRKFLNQFDNTDQDISQQDMQDYMCYQQSLQTCGNILMQYFQMQSILRVPEKERPDDLDMVLSQLIPKIQQKTPNIFEELIGPGWAKKFDQHLIQNNNNAISIGLQHLIYEIYTSNLPTEKKNLANQFIEVTKEAFFIDRTCKRFANMMNSASPSILKIYHNTSRLDRAIDNIDTYITKLRIYNIKSNYIPIFFTGMSISFNWKYKTEGLCSKIVVKVQQNKKDKKNKSKNDISNETRMFAVGVLLGVIISEYCKKIESNDYLSMWYITMLIKFMEITSFAPSHQKAADPQMSKSIELFFHYLDIVVSKYCVVFPASEQIKSLPLELQEMDLRVPTKEEWEIMKLPPEEQEKIWMEREQKARALIEDNAKRTKSNPIIDLSTNTALIEPPKPKETKNNEDYITLGTNDIQLTLTLPKLEEEDL